VTPSTVTASHRQAARRSAVAKREATLRRRRRSALAIVILGLVVAVVVLGLPVARRAVNELGLPLRYQGVIRQQAAAKHLDPALVAAVIYAETKFDARTSSAGAQGLMQILPETARFLAHKSGATSFTTADLGTPRVNIAYGSYYLRYLLDKYHDSTILALAAYNGGEANVDSWVRASRAHGESFAISDIPFPETRAYVQRVLGARRDYRRTYATQLGYS
jgi:soluble lytic murein transglycosylase